MTALRLIADDLTGALDAGAQFTGACGPLPCALGPVGAWPARDSLVVDLGCRDGSEPAAVGANRAALPLLDGAAVAFKKIDSLLRGHWAAELAAVFDAGPFAAAVLAPAFPAQNRVTRGGRQWVRFPGRAWARVDPDPAAALAAHGVRVLGPAASAGSAPLPRGVVAVCDAETEADLAAVCARFRGAKGPVLWCGSAGLARALAGSPPRPVPVGGRPHLAVVGTDNPVSLRQVAHLRATAPERVVAFDGDAPASAARIAAALDRAGACLAVASPPEGVARPEAAGLIAAWLGPVFGRLPRPACVSASGGETFLALCRGLGVDHLLLLGEQAPGLPVSRLVGGVWNGATVLSKSGAFGDEALWSRLLT